MKRANGTGTIVHLGAGRRRPYAVRIAARDDHGHIVQRAISYHATMREAQAALDDYNAKKQQGILPSVLSNVTLEQVYNAWSARAFQKMGVGSIRSYSAAWKHRVSSLSQKKIQEISLDDWQRIIDADEQNGSSGTLINKDIILIRALCRYALQRDIISKDYSQFIERPTVGAKVEKGAFSELQLKKIEELAKKRYKNADTVLILCYTGFRISELLELTRFSYHPEYGGYLQGGKKTAAGKDRIVPIHKKIKPYVETWLSKGGNTIFCNTAGERMQRDAYVTDFSDVMEKIGVPNATPHWCRHTFATLAHNSGLQELTIKWLMGHSTENNITAHYTHSNIQILRSAIDQIA